MADSATADKGKAPIRNLAEIEPYPHTIAAIYAAYEAANRDDERTYLGCSTFGTDCNRALWYSFRWATPNETFDGRMLRLFATGHREEERMVADLRAAGVDVLALDPETGRQWAVSAIGGHLRGHLDGIGKGVPEAPAAVHVFEFKTHSNESFLELKRKSVKLSKPGHYRQMTLYMHLKGIKRALYMAHNKNNDELHVERLEYNLVDAYQLMARAERIIAADKPPPRLHPDPTAKTAFECGYCRHLNVCHKGSFPRINCRTCLHSTAVEGGWHCARHDEMIDKETQKSGCGNHLLLPGLVPGKQIDCDVKAETVTYKLNNGEIWIDGIAA